MRGGGVGGAVWRWKWVWFEWRGGVILGCGDSSAIRGGVPMSWVLCTYIVAL